MLIRVTICFAFLTGNNLITGILICFVFFPFIYIVLCIIITNNYLTFTFLHKFNSSELFKETIIFQFQTHFFPFNFIYITKRVNLHPLVIHASLG